MELLCVILKFPRKIFPDGRVNVSLVGDDHLDSPRAKIFPRPSPHSMTDDDCAVMQSFCYGLMLMRITVAVMMFSVIVVPVLPPEVSGEGILSHGAVDGIPFLDFVDGEVWAAPEMSRNLLSILCGNRDFHWISSFL
jgi:hypothetical protein